jgi:hypothetical protein
MKKYTLNRAAGIVIKNSCLILIAILPFEQSGCKKLVTVESPITSLTSTNVYNNDATAAAVLTGIYTSLSQYNYQPGTSFNSISLASGLSADELTLAGGSSNSNTLLAQFYLNALTAGNVTVPQGMWSVFYSNIYTVNVAIERLAESNSLTPIVKQQLTGEAKFVRAFCYFYLTNLYGAVPLTTNSDFTVNALLSRSAPTLVYQQIIADLKAAQSLLSNDYVASDAESSTTERVRPNKWAATALLARAYLYTGDWADAAAQATAIISNSSMYSLTPLNNVFLKNNNEAIWQLQPVDAGWNTPDARVFILPLTGPTIFSTPSYPAYLSLSLLTSFEPGDQRRVNWVDSVTTSGATYYYPYKYKNATLNAAVTEYTMVLRLGEQYLIRAEVEAHGASGNAVVDLDIIRNRAGLPNYAGPMDPASLLNAIYHERQVELFTEWGHRWLDLKRTGTVSSVMTTVAPLKKTTWNSGWQLYPLPSYDIKLDPNLVQNPGY